MTLEDKLELCEARLARWHSRLYRAAGEVKSLDAQRRRILDRIYERDNPNHTQQRPAGKLAAPELDDGKDIGAWTP